MPGPVCTTAQVGDIWHQFYFLEVIKRMKNILIYPIALLFAAGFVMSCDNILEPSVDQEIPTETAIENVGDLNAVVLGIHDELNEFELFGRDFYVSPDVMSDNAWSNENSGRFINQRDFNFPITHSYPAGVWNNFYVAIAGANIAINAELEESGPDVDHAKGQAYALRGFSHMNLLLAFGQQFVEGGDPAHGIPYVTSYADEENQYPQRDSIQEVWENIIDDLNSAENLLNQDQFDPTLMNYYAVKGSSPVSTSTLKITMRPLQQQTPSLIQVILHWYLPMTWFPGGLAVPGQILFLNWLLQTQTVSQPITLRGFTWIPIMEMLRSLPTSITHMRKMMCEGSFSLMKGRDDFV